MPGDGFAERFAQTRRDQILSRGLNGHVIDTTEEFAEPRRRAIWRLHRLRELVLKDGCAKPSVSAQFDVLGTCGQRLVCPFSPRVGGHRDVWSSSSSYPINRLSCGKPGQAQYRLPGSKKEGRAGGRPQSKRCRRCRTQGIFRRASICGVLLASTVRDRCRGGRLPFGVGACLARIGHWFGSNRSSFDLRCRHRAR